MKTFERIQVAVRVWRLLLQFHSAHVLTAHWAGPILGGALEVLGMSSHQDGTFTGLHLMLRPPDELSVDAQAHACSWRKHAVLIVLLRDCVRTYGDNSPRRGMRSICMM